MIIGLLASALLLLPTLVSGQTALAQADRDPLLNTYIEELVDLRFGGIAFCNPAGERAVLAKVSRRLSVIKSSLILRFGADSVAAAEADVEPAFADAWGSFSPAGCKIGDAVWDSRNLRNLRRRHDAALATLERALGLVRERHG